MYTFKNLSSKFNIIERYKKNVRQGKLGVVILTEQVNERGGQGLYLLVYSYFI